MRVSVKMNGHLAMKKFAVVLDYKTRRSWYIVKNNFKKGHMHSTVSFLSDPVKNVTHANFCARHYWPQNPKVGQVDMKVTSTYILAESRDENQWVYKFLF